jgi:uncharacterized membrane protein
MVFSVFVPATRGFFNIGEIMVYTAAILGGPLVGAFAGGLGSMLADLALGYPQFAPGTLVIKGVEGLIVGYLVRHPPEGLSRTRWRVLAIVVATGVALLVGIIGVLQYSGEGSLSLGLPALGTVTIPAVIPQALWVGTAVLAFALLVYAGFSVSPQVGWLALAVLAGGAEMVTGYFVYELGALQLTVQAALVEVPINVGQFLVGLLVALPLTRAVQRLFPSTRPQPPLARASAP